MSSSSRSFWVITALMMIALPVSGQEIRGGLEVRSEGGYLTNPFLDPMASFWDPTFESSFVAVGSTARVAWSGRRSSMEATASGRFVNFTEGFDSWSSGNLTVSGTRALGGSMSMGIDVGGRIFRGDIHQESVYVVPNLRWRVTPRTRLTVRPGVSHQTTAIASGASSSSTSLVGSVGVKQWVGWQTRIGASLQGSRTEVPGGNETFSGVGGSVNLTRRLLGRGSVRAVLGLLQYGYEVAAEGGTGPLQAEEIRQQDYLWRATLAAEWPLSSRVSLFARTRGARFHSSTTAEATHDLQVSSGLRVSLRGSIYALSEPEPVWTQDGDIVRFRVVYEGEGALFLVGDFNDWDSPGRPMQASGGDVYTAELRLNSGTHRYRIRIQRGGDEEWLPLPEHTLQTTDDFGGTNGLLIIE